jgi:predicted  nucleic acid-binding Zn-ribbon protein
MWKYIGYAGIILPVLGATYGGLQIASHLENQLDMNTQMAEDAHARISDIEQSIDMTIENIKFSLEAMNEKLNYKFEDTQRELIQLNKTIAIIESTTQTLEKNSFNNATMIQFQGLQDLIYQQKEALMELKNATGPMDMTPMFYELQNRIMELERRVDDLHKNWN